MTREDLISDIEGLFPIDSSFESTNDVGERLLLEAIRESDWRDLPTDILALYRAKCVSEDNRQARTVRNLWT